MDYCMSHNLKYVIKILEDAVASWLVCLTPDQAVKV